MTELSQSAFTNACKTATERLWKHRSAMHRVAVRIGFWPDGMVISATISARNDEELAANTLRLIPWDEVATLSEQRLVEIVDEVCAPAYRALGIRAA